MERQILTLVNHLPSKFQKLDELLKSSNMSKVISFYREFNKYIESDVEVIKTLEFVNKYGDENTALYQWRKDNPNLD